MTFRRELLVVFVLLALALLCYATIIPTYFLSDDFVLIGRVIQQGWFLTWGTGTGGFFRPGSVLAFLLDYQVWKLNPVGYHLTNVIFHAGAAYALYLMGCRLLGKAGLDHPRTLSFLAACLFVSLACHSESVSWIAGRGDVISVALGLGSTAAFLFLLDSRSLLSSGAALLLLCGALLTKEPLVVLPPIWGLLVVHHWWTTRERPSTRSLVTLGIACILLVGYFGLRKAILGYFIGGYGTGRHLSLLHVQTFVNLYRFSLRTFLPALPLRFFGLGALPWLLAAGFVIGGVATGLAFRRKPVLKGRWPLLAVLVLCYLASLVPVVTMHIGLFDTQGERYLYLPSAFACLAVAGVVGVGFHRRKVQSLVLVCLVLVHALSLQWVNQRWISASRISEQVAKEVSQTDPNNTVVLNVPDNYQGAYIFRNGLRQAATLFVGSESSQRYRSISTHSLWFMQQYVHVEVTGSNIVFTIPEGTAFHQLREEGFELMGRGRTLSVSIGDEQDTNGLKFLSFSSASNLPMLRTIEWSPH